MVGQQEIGPLERAVKVEFVLVIWSERYGYDYGILVYKELLVA